MAQTGFPSLQPALIIRLNVGNMSNMGAIHGNGSKLFHCETPTGTIETVKGFEPAFKANVVFGADWLSFDADGGHARVDLRGIAKTDASSSIDFRFSGVIKMTPVVIKIFTGAPDMTSMPFGAATGTSSFIVADPALKFLENSVFATNSRILVTEKGLVVENRQSIVISSDLDS